MVDAVVQSFRIFDVAEEGAETFVRTIDGMLDEAAERAGRPFWGETLRLQAVDTKGQLVGGLVGARVQGWLLVRYLAVRGDKRGLGIGARLLAEAQERARSERLAGVYLDTFDFQAPAFYLKQGFREIGRLPSVGESPQRIWFAKPFDMSESEE